MTSTRPPRVPLPDWSDGGIREGTASLTVDPDELAQPLAMGTSEDATGEGLALPPVGERPTVPASGPRPLDRLRDARAAGPSAPAANDFDDDGEDRTKADDQPAGALLGASLPEAAEDRTKVDVRVMRPRPPQRKGTQVDEDGLTLVGTTLGSYRLLARIGKGGMGFVYRAEHVRLGREVALKLLRQDYAKRKDAVARFFQEARTVNRVRHRNIVDVTDFVELDDGTTFIIMELLTGQSLGSWVKSGIEIPRALGVLAQICDGLGAAHSVSVVHRDLKPDNIIIAREPDGAEVVKLLDFGVAKLINQGDDDFGVETAAGSVVGTPAYMSPEQAGGLPIDGRSDIYSLGAIMYELFCGQPMFRGRSFGEFVRKHLTEQPPPPRSTPRGNRLDPRIEQIILRAIEKEPSRRYQAVTELRDALLGLLGDYQALGQSGQRRLPPLPGESGRMPALMPNSGAVPALGPSSHPGILPPPAAGPHLPAPMLPTPMRSTGRSTGGAPLVDLTMESEENSRSGARLGPPSGYGQQSTHMVRTMPWYVWFAGGALAVGLGIGGATWYALSTEAKPAAVAAAPAASLVEIRLTSSPEGAGVYKEGGTTELCRTPCALNLDPAEFGGITVRPFVLRREGFADTSLVVDLRAPQREFKVELAAKPALSGGDEGAKPGEPAPTPVEDAAPSGATTPVEDAAPLGDPPSPDASAATDATDGAKASRAQPATNRRKVTKGAGSSGGDADFEMPADAPGEPAAPVAKPTESKPTPAPDASKAGKIDRSETIDPFRSRP